MAGQALMNWEPKDRRKKVARDVQAIKSGISNLVSPSPAAPVTGAGTNFASTFAGGLRDRVDASKAEAIAGGVMQPDFMRDINLPPVPAFSQEAGAAVPTVAPPVAPQGAVTVPTAATPPSGEESGYRIVEGPNGPILTNVGGDANVTGQVGALRDRGVSAVLPSGQELLNTRTGEGGGAVRNMQTTPGLNEFTFASKDQPGGTTTGTHGEQDLRTNRPGGQAGFGGSADTLQHFMNVQRGISSGNLAPAGGGAIQNMPTVMPAGAPLPNIAPENTFNPAPATGEARAYVPANDNENAPIFNPSPSQDPNKSRVSMEKQSLNDLGAFMVEQDAARTAAIPKLPTDREPTYDELLARGYGLAGKGRNMASALVRKSQAEGYANKQLDLSNLRKNQTRADRKTALGENRLALDQAEFDAGAEGRIADTRVKVSQARTAEQKVSALSTLTEAEFKSYLLGSKSKGAITAKQLDDRANDIATELSQSFDPKYQGLSLTQLHGLAYQELQDQLNMREQGKRLVLTPGQEKVDSFLGFGGSEAIPATVNY